MDFLKYNYLQFYTDLRLGKITFHEFMDYTNHVFLMGKEIGSLEGQSQAIQRMSDHIEDSKNAR